MPFHRIENETSRSKASDTATISAKSYLPSQPWPLVVAILDREFERHRRTTAVLVSEFEYEHPKTRERVRVPEGYVTDFASIPGLMRAVIQPFGRHAKAAVLHDWLYVVGEPKQREFADAVFRQAMKELGVPFFRRSVMYLSVRLFGGKPYRIAENEWQWSWADWKSGTRVPPPSPREDWYNNSHRIAE